MFVAEVVQPVVEGPLWAQIVYAVIAAVLGIVVVPYLRQKAAESRASLETLKAAQIAVGAGASQIIMGELKTFLYDRASSIVEKDFPKIAADIVAGKLKTADQVKAVLHSLGVALKDEAITYFHDHQGIDLVRLVGEEQLAKMIEHAANAVSPFPGKETAVAFLKNDAAKWLLEKGVHMIADYMSRDEPEPAAVIAAATAAGAED